MINAIVRSSCRFAMFPNLLPARIYTLSKPLKRKIIESQTSLSFLKTDRIGDGPFRLFGDLFCLSNREKVFCDEWVDYPVTTLTHQSCSKHLVTIDEFIQVSCPNCGKNELTIAETLGLESIYDLSDLFEVTYYES